MLSRCKSAQTPWGAESWHYFVLLVEVSAEEPRNELATEALLLEKVLLSPSTMATAHVCCIYAVDQHRAPFSKAANTGLFTRAGNIFFFRAGYRASLKTWPGLNEHLMVWIRAGFKPQQPETGIHHSKVWGSLDPASRF